MSRRGDDQRDKTTRRQEKQCIGLLAMQTRREADKCTYPGDSVVMMGFNPSFFRFLFIAELPFEAVALAGATGGCAEASFALLEPFMLAMCGVEETRCWGGRSLCGSARPRGIRDQVGATPGGGAKRAVLGMGDAARCSRDLVSVSKLDALDTAG